MNSPTTDTAATCGCACGEAAEAATGNQIQAGATLARRRVVQLGAAAVTGALTVGLLAACGSDDKDADGDDDGDKAAAPATSPSASDSAAAGAVVAKLADVAVGSTVVVDGVAGDPLVIYRSSETAVTAFSAKCTHKFCPVKVSSDALDCPCHGSTFDLKTGARISGVATDPLPARSVAIKGDDIVLA